jgi:hypothetical protein
MSHLLQRKVAAARRQVRLLLVGYGLSWVVSIVLAGLLILAGTDYLLRFEDRGVRLIWSLAALGLGLWVVARYLVPAFRQRLDDVVVAQRIESYFAGTSDQLSSAIEFLNQRADDPLSGSATLRRAAVAQTEARIGTLDWSRAIDRRPVVRAAAVAGAIGLIVAAICLVSPMDARLALARLIRPLGDDAWPPVNDLAFTRHVERVALEQPFEVELIDRNHNLPDEVRIQYRHADERGAVQVDQDKMQLIGDMMVARKERVTRAFDYRAEGGDDHKMAWIHVDVVEPPRIQSLQITLHPPAYTGWPVQPSERRIVALRGTVVEISATTTKPLVAAILHQQNGPEIRAQITADGRGFSIRPESQPRPQSQPQPQPSAVPSASLSGESSDVVKFVAVPAVASSLVIDKSGQYWFELRDREDLVGGLADRWDIQAVRDQPPSVMMKQPAANLFVTAAASVPVKIVARDDLAIHQITLVYSRSDHSEAGETVIRLFTGPEQPPPSTPLGAADLSTGKTQTIDYSWELGPLGLAPGTHVLLWATATDYLPQSASSPPRRLTIITPEELEDRLAQRQSMIDSELSRVLQMQRAARLQTSVVQTQLAAVGRLQKSDVDQLRGDELSQRQIRRSLVSPTEGVRAQIVSLLAELTSNRVDNLEIRRRMQSLADETARLDRQELPAAERELTAALKNTDDVSAPPPAAASRALAEAFRQQDAIVAALEKMLGDLAEWNSFRGVSRELTQIRREQADLEKGTKESLSQTLTKDPRDLTPSQQADLRMLAQRQLDLASRFDKLEQRMEQVGNQLKESDPFSAESIADALHAARQKALGGLMRESGDAVRQNRIGQALAQQSAVRGGLDEILDILANRREQELSRLVQKLRESERHLADLRQEELGLHKRLKEASAEPDPTQRRAELQRLSRRQRELQEESTRLAHQLQRLQADQAARATTRAAEEMDQSGRAADDGDADSSSRRAESAGKDLDEAQRQLAEVRRKAEADLAHEQLARLEDSLKGLVDRQQRMVEQTVRLEKLRSQQGQWSREQAQSVHDLSREQQALSVETGQLGAKLSGVAAFQFVLDAAARGMGRAAEQLKDRDTGGVTQQLEQDALARLQQLTAALAEDQTGAERQTGGDSGPGGPGQSPGSTQRTMAEVRLIRLMQEDLNRRTRRLDEAIGRGKQPNDQQRTEFAELTKEQGRLAELILDLTDGD